MLCIRSNCDSCGHLHGRNGHLNAYSIALLFITSEPKPQSAVKATIQPEENSHACSFLCRCDTWLLKPVPLICSRPTKFTGFQSAPDCSRATRADPAAIGASSRARPEARGGCSGPPRLANGRARCKR